MLNLKYVNNYHIVDVYCVHWYNGALYCLPNWQVFLRSITALTAYTVTRLNLNSLDCASVQIMVLHIENRDCKQLPMQLEKKLIYLHKSHNTVHQEKGIWEQIRLCRHGKSQTRSLSQHFTVKDSFQDKFICNQEAYSERAIECLYTMTRC